MERLCERPGCSDPASVAYGMRPEDLVFWLAALDSSVGSHGVLCRRHADSMVVPRSWTLDDQRDPDLRLFRPPEATSAAPSTRRSSRRGRTDDQLRLGIDDGDGEVAVPDDSAAGAEVVEADDELDEPAEAWTPSFDDDDDLDGLLAARSPLLARAFRGADRPRR